MHYVRRVTRLGSAALAAGLAFPVSAERIVVAPGDGPLQAILDRAAEGDVVELAAGEHRGPARVERKLVVEGKPGAVLDGGGQGNVITVTAPEAVVRGLTIRGSGMDLEKMNSGVFITKTSVRAVVEGNKIEGNLYGVYIHGAAEAVVRKNEIIGIPDGRMNDAGNGVSVWDAPGAKVLDNSFRYGRDGIFSIASRKNVFSGNVFRDLRFAIHYMYTNDGELTNNTSISNTVGYAVMFSHRLTIVGNVSDGDRDRGFLFNFANGSRIEGNTVLGRLQAAERWATTGMHRLGAREHGVPVEREPEATSVAGARIGPEKCVFI